jgi:hypothetical protein
MVTATMQPMAMTTARLVGDNDEEGFVVLAIDSHVPREVRKNPAKHVLHDVAFESVQVRQVASQLLPMLRITAAFVTKVPPPTLTEAGKDDTLDPVDVPDS